MPVFNDRKEIAKVLEDLFQTKVIINPMFAENALIKLEDVTLEDFIEELGKWQAMGPFHFLFEKWIKFKHNHPLLVRSFGGWIKIKNLPMDYWSRKTFEAIGAYIGGLEDIAAETLNLLNCWEAKIKVKRNLCGQEEKLENGWLKMKCF